MVNEDMNNNMCAPCLQSFSSLQFHFFFVTAQPMQVLQKFSELTLNIILVASGNVSNPLTPS